MINLKKFNLLILLFIFLYIYSPPLLSFNISHILFVISIVYIFKSYFEGTLVRFSTKFLIGFLMGLISVILLIITIIFTTRDFLVVYGVFIVFIELIPIAFAISLKIKKTKLSFIDVLNHIILAGLIQSIISLVMFLNIDIKDYIITTFYDYYLTSDSMVYWSRLRIFGFSQSMLYGFSIAQGFIAAVSIYLSINKSPKYLLSVPLLVFSSVVNSRFGVVIFLLLTFYFIFLSLASLKFSNLFKLLFIVLIGFGGFIYLLNFIESLSPELHSWIEEGISEISKMIQGESTGYFIALEEMFILPSFNEVFVGTGADKYFNPIGSNSDIGFINDLFLGGLLFITLFYIGILLILISKSSNRMINSIMIGMVLVVLISNIKGFSFRHNEQLNLAFLLSFTIGNYKIVSKKIYKRNEMIK